MNAQLNLLLVEDSENDAAMIVRLLEKAGYKVHWELIEDAGQMRDALSGQQWDAVISDYNLPQFDALSALTLTQQSGFDIPFIVVSGCIGEETAVEMMKAGAKDYIMKDNLSRLAPALERELRDSQALREQRRTEAALHESDQRFHAAFENAAIGMALIAPDGNFLKVNNALCELTGYSEKELLSRNLMDITHPDDQENSLKNMHKTLSGEINHYHLEKRYIHKQGQVIWVLLSISLVRNNDNGPLYFISQIQDISEHKKYELELQELNISKDKFFSIIAHDLKSMFNNILGFSDLLKTEIRTSDAATIEQYIDMINSSAHQTYAILASLLEWANSQRGKIPFNPAPVVLSELLNEELDVLRKNAGQKNIELKICIPDNFVLTADKDMLKTILRNLISNAIKFTPKNGKIELHATQGGQQVEIAVCDNGAGMTRKTLDKLFKLDIINSTPGTENERGTGLGLMLCSDFVKKHGGKIWAESECGKGSTFKFTMQS
jgi:PAS domain S-box-containing protein